MAVHCPVDKDLAFFEGSDSGRRDKRSFKLFLGWEAGSLCGQHNLGVHYNCTSNLVPLVFLPGGAVPLHPPPPFWQSAVKTRLW